MSWWSVADTAVFMSLVVSLAAYGLVARREHSFLNILTPDYLLAIPATYILPVIYVHLFGQEGSTFAFVYVFATMAVENLIFALVYTRRSNKTIVLPFSFSYRNFLSLAILLLVFAFVVYLPILMQFPDLLLDPRQIYARTRVGYGGYFFVSATLADLSVIFALFSKQSWRIKAALIGGALVVLSLHGSKGQVLAVFLLWALYEVYARRRKVRFFHAAVAVCGMAILIIGLFIATAGLAGSAGEALEGIAEYSDYTRNAMLVIDQKFPLQYGRITLEGNLYTLVPRALFPDKPKNFGPFRLAEEYYPKAFDVEEGAPAFGIGIQYADFGLFAIVYLAAFAAFRGWLARIFVNRLRQTNHPSDFVMVAFLAGMSLFPVGTGWLFPETVAVVFVVRFLSSMGSGPVYRERVGFHGARSNAVT
jgi:oligosaccharide repeat unit polymerase